MTVVRTGKRSADQIRERARVCEKCIKTSSTWVS
jgi:hypothetical protein